MISLEVGAFDVSVVMVFSLFNTFTASPSARPDGKEMFQVPGSEAEDGKDHVTAWLNVKGWKAW